MRSRSRCWRWLQWWTRRRPPLGGSTWRAWGSVAVLLLLACHAQGRTRTGLKSKLADGVAAVLADPVRAGLELLERVLGLAQARPSVGRHRDLVLALGRLGARVGLVVARSVARGTQQVVELVLGELELDAVLVDLLEQHASHLADLVLAPRALVVLDAELLGELARARAGRGGGGGLLRRRSGSCCGARRHCCLLGSGHGRLRGLCALSTRTGRRTGGRLLRRLLGLGGPARTCARGLL